MPGGGHLVFILIDHQTGLYIELSTDFLVPDTFSQLRNSDRDASGHPITIALALYNESKNVISSLQHTPIFHGRLLTPDCSINKADAVVILMVDLSPFYHSTKED